MRYGYVKLRPGKCPREGRVRIAVDQEPVRLLLERDRLDAGEHRSGLGPVAARSDTQVYIGPRDRELAEEQVRHRVVVVLPGVDEELFVCLAQDARDGRGLDEVPS